MRSKQGAIKCAYGPFSRGKYKAHPCVTEYAKGKQCIKNMRDGATAGYKYFDLEGMYLLQIKTRGDAGVLLVHETLQGEPTAIIPLLKSKDWVKSECKIQMNKGKTALYFTYKGEGEIDFLSFSISK